jgi:hypothetical protein
MSMRRVAVALLLVSGCGTETGGSWRVQQDVRAMPAAVQLNREPTIFIRAFGSGLMPPLQAPVSYRLCVDLGHGTIVDVQDVITQKSVDDQVANVLRGWKWGIESSIRVTGGVRCFRERFEPFEAGDGQPAVRAVPEGPVRVLRLEEDGISDVGATAPEDVLHVASVDMFEGGGVRYILLQPRVSVRLPNRAADPKPPTESPSPSFQKIAGGMPHLPDLVKIRFRGNTLTALYRVCVDAGGSITKLVPEIPVDGAGPAIANALRTWVYSQARVPVCVLSRFVFTVSR